MGNLKANIFQLFGSFTDSATITSDAKIKTVGTQTILSDAKIKALDVSQTILSNAAIKITAIQENILSDAKVAIQKNILSDASIKVLAIQEDILSDANVTNTRQVTILSDALIKVTDIQEDILSDANIVIQKLILSDAIVKVTNIQENILSDSKIKVTGIQEDILSDGKVVFQYQNSILSDAKIKVAGIQESILSDAFVIIQVLSDVNNDFRSRKLYYKEFYCNAGIIKNSQKDFYLNMPTVSQSPVYVPTGLIATNMLKGDLIKLTWTADSNYGYNVYTTSPGPRTKQNTFPVIGTEFLCGNLTENTAYTFVVVGVNGIGTESADSISAIGTPTYPDFSGGVSRFDNYTVVVKINNVARADILLTTVELGYGTSPAIARFTIPKDPATVGLPVNNDEIEVIVNSRSIFKGIIKNLEKSISNSGMAVSYMAFSKLIELTYSCVSQGFIDGVKNTTNIDVSDQTWLQAYETLANFYGNYRLYWNMDTDELERYQLGTGYWNRTVEIGKNVIEWNITEDVLNRVNSMTLRGGNNNYTTPWQPFYWDASYVPGSPFIYRVSIGAWNISNIQVQAAQSIGQPEIEYDPDISIIPSDVGLDTWADGTKEPKQLVTSYDDPPWEWRGASVEIQYHTTSVGNEEIPTSATIILTAQPKIYEANIKHYSGAVRNGRVTTEDTHFGTVSVAMPTKEKGSSFRLSYSYTDQYPNTTNIGGGTLPSRTVTDSQYSYTQDNLNNYNDSSWVLGQMAQRVAGEFAKVNVTTRSGRIQIVGDETFNLKTLVEVEGEKLDVIRVTHNFSNGFTTDLELTNERFRINVPPYQEMRKNIDYQRATVGTQALLSGFKNKIEQPKTVGGASQDPARIVPYSSNALYGD